MMNPSSAPSMQTATGNRLKVARVSLNSKTVNLMEISCTTVYANPSMYRYSISVDK